MQDNFTSESTQHSSPVATPTSTDSTTQLNPLPHSSSKHYKPYHAWVIAVTAAIAMMCGLGLGRFAFGMLLPSMSSSLALSYSESGVLGFTNLVGYLLSVMISPLVIPKLGIRITTTLCLLLIALSMLGMALSSNFYLLCVLYFITGVGCGGVVLPMMSGMSQWFYPSHRGLALGVVMSGAGLGIILSGFVVPKLIPGLGLFSWQIGWLFFSLLSTLVALLVFMVMRNTPKDIGMVPFGIPPKHPVTTQQKIQRKDIKLLLFLGIIFSIYGATYMIYVTFIVTSMVDKYLFSEALSGQLWAGIGFLSMFSGLLFGWISDHIGRRMGLVLSFFFLAVAYLLVGIHGWHYGIYLSIFIFGMAVWSVPVIMAACAGDYFGTAAAASALAALTFSFAGGQSLGPILAGMIAEITGDFTQSYFVSGIAALVAVGLSLLLRARQPR